LRCEKTDLGVRRAKAVLYQWVRDPPGYLAPAGSIRGSQGGNELAEAPELKGRTRRSSECTGFNVSERWASLEKVDAQADPTTLSGKADMFVEIGRRIATDAAPG
jgi:hypothetical protein